MSDFPFAYNVTGQNLTLPTSEEKLSSWAASTLNKIPPLQYPPLMSLMNPGTINFFFFLADGDLTDPPSGSGNVGRYFHPGDYAGRAFMVSLPKVQVSMNVNATTGDPIFIRYFFWTESAPLERMPEPFSVTDALNAVSHEVEFIEPLPEGAFTLPTLADLPSDFYSRNLKSSIITLTGRIPK